jgi:hypothetical protein
MPQWFGSCAVCVIVVLTACDEAHRSTPTSPSAPRARTGAVLSSRRLPDDLYLAPGGTVDIREIPAALRRSTMR